VLSGREAAGAAASAAKLRAEGGDAYPLQLDVNDADSVRGAMREIEQRFGRLDVLVNNAGVMLDGRWGQNTTPTISEDALHETFDTNFFGVVHLTRAALPLLLRGRSPQVINVSSLAGSLTAQADLAGPLAAVKPFAYDASKAALNAFTIHLAAALARDGIRVNSVHPGWVQTHMGNVSVPPGRERDTWSPWKRARARLSSSPSRPPQRRRRSSCS
jgi:NAD(P)-dependent dehydrogenase (short-subunit alcohol dehydrogenase family)